MKRFIIISVLAAVCGLRASACLWIATDNYYLFSIYDNTEFSYRADQTTRDNWKAYLGRTADTYYYFNADEVIAAARAKDDALMVSYVENLQKYLDCAREVSQETWNYPTKEELAERAQALSGVRAYALSKVKTRLRSQHALLYMRCNMLMGRHQDNVSFWEETAKDFIETVYKDMMENIYAGALLKCGRGNEASQIFARQGDWQSLMTQFYEHRSYEAICKEYLRDANSAVLPFLLQDFVNNVQEAADNDGYGKLFVRDINHEEAEQMVELCTQAVREQKSQLPIMWQTAKAWIEYMLGARQEALADIREAVGYEGPERLANVARIINDYITFDVQPLNASLENMMASELRWLQGLTSTNYYYDNAYKRIAHQTVIPKFQEAGRLHTALQLKSFLGGGYEAFLDTATVDDVLAHLAYCKRPAMTAFDKFVKENSSDAISEDVLNDLIGTKHLRLCKWQEAIEWLAQVSVSYYAEKGYARYASLRHWSVEPWVRRQWLTEAQQWGDDVPAPTQNPKLAFAREMLQMEGEALILNGQALYQRQYDLAIRYAQAHYSGDCWFLLHDTKSPYDELQPNEVDYAQKAVDLLRKAGRTTSRQLKERVLFARSYVYLNPDSWYTEEWNRDISDFVRKVNKDTQQYRAFAALADFEKTNADGPATYVSRCDEYIQFKKSY